MKELKTTLYFTKLFANIMVNVNLTHHGIRQRGQRQRCEPKATTTEISIKPLLDVMLKIWLLHSSLEVVIYNATGYNLTFAGIKEVLEIIVQMEE